MNTTRQDWDCFWADHSPEQSRFNDDPDTWSGLVWKVGLEDWHRIFEALAPGKRMLECGCGSAKVSRYMAQRGYACTMLDYSEAAINLAKTNFKALSLPGQFIIGDISRLPFTDNHFDVIYSGGVLEFFADIQAPIREMVRVLKPGGLFAANIVPNKFSCQTLADVERTLAHSLKCVCRGRVRDAFTVLHHLPAGVSKASLRDYIRFCKTVGLTAVTGRCITPFPALSLGKRGNRLYAKLLQRLLPVWRRFNESGGCWHEFWGMAYMIYGIKPG